MARIATVTAVDNDKRVAKVLYNQLNIPSSWLPVLNNRDFVPDYEDKAPVQRTEFESGGAGFAAFENHKHDLTIKPYMPKIGDLVVVIFVEGFNADGVILGGITPWK